MNILLTSCVALTLSAAASNSSADNAPLRLKIQKNLGSKATVYEVSNSNVGGFYRVNIGKKVIYSDRTGRYLFVGSLMDSEKNINITDSDNRDIFSREFKNLPTKNAIVFKYGSGVRKIAVFEDPECPYCKKLEQNIENLQNTTVFVYIAPILGENSKKLANLIFCSGNMNYSWRNQMRNNVAPSNKPCNENASEENLRLAANLGISATPTIITSAGNRSAGYLSMAQLNKLIEFN
ncbi:MAG: DsbC family protein [Burkholderia gladioli]